jgi:hypothetical protein
MEKTSAVSNTESKWREEVAIGRTLNPGWSGKVFA